MKRIVMTLVALLVATVFCIAQEDKQKKVPADKDVIAVVLGRNITANDRDRFDGLIVGALFESFARENKIEPTKKELGEFIVSSRKHKQQMNADFQRDRKKLKEELKLSSLSDSDRKETETRLETIESILKTNEEMRRDGREMGEEGDLMEREVAQQFVQAWKINKALYEKYGGRVIFQQAGMEPLDACRDFLKEQEKKGAFRIIDKELEGQFWLYFTNDAMHTFCSKENGAEAFRTPWWLIEKQPEE